MVGYDQTNQLETILVEDDWLDQPAGDYYCAGLASQCCDVVLVGAHLAQENPWGSGSRNGEGWKRGDQFTSNLGPGWTDPVTARRVPSK